MFMSVGTVLTNCMGDYLSSSDWDKIREFANTPVYERDPDILVPGENHDDEE